MSKKILTSGAGMLHKLPLLAGTSAALLLLTCLASYSQQQGQKKDLAKTRPTWKGGTYINLIQSRSHEILNMPPANFAVPQYSPAKLVSGTRVVNGYGSNTTLVFSSHDAPVTVANWYKQSLKAAGWKTRQSMPGLRASSASFFGARKGESCSVSVQTDGTGGSSIVTHLRQK